VRLSRRVESLPPYLFVEISRKIAERKARGEDVVSFGIGDPDIPTPPHIIERLCKEAHVSANHRYPESEGLPELRKTIANWYQRRFGVSLDPEKEVAPLIGSKEGIAHIALCLLNPGDTALITDPGYPVYSIGTSLVGGVPYYLPISPQNHFLPDLDNIPAQILEKTKILWLNYPNNPTGAVADLKFFNKAVEFAKKHNICICHDGPYSEVAFDGYAPVSFLQAEGAKDVGIEFHSLSKTYNMTGWRIGMAVGNAAVINALKTVKSNIDSGIPQAIQYAAIEALNGPQDCIKEHNNLYQQRRDLIVDTLNKMGLETIPPKASLYIWAKVPNGYTSVEFATDLLDKVGVVVIPGIGYGQNGEGYIRLSVTIADASLLKGLSRMAQWHDGKNILRPKKV
jgi:LL-diaminopimelate aminotransferase